MPAFEPNYPTSPWNLAKSCRVSRPISASGNILSCFKACIASLAKRTPDFVFSCTSREWNCIEWRAKFPTKQRNAVSVINQSTITTPYILVATSYNMFSVLIRYYPHVSSQELINIICASCALHLCFCSIREIASERRLVTIDCTPRASSLQRYRKSAATSSSFASSRENFGLASQKSDFIDIDPKRRGRISTNIF